MLPSNLMNCGDKFQKLSTMIFYIALIESYFNASHFEDHSQQIVPLDHVHLLFLT